nr:TetR/AcrR family transcriptional regulator [Ardenticatena sp.]
MADEQKRHILDTATRLFVAHGYKGLSMREIATATGLSKAGLYHHFKTKEELFIAVLEENIDIVAALVEAAHRDHTTLRDQLTAILTGIFTLPPERRAIIRLASQEMAALQPDTRQRFMAHYQAHFIQRLDALMQAAIQRGEVRPLPSRMLTWFFLGMAYPFFYPAHQNDLLDPVQTAEMMVDVFLNGVLARP